MQMTKKFESRKFRGVYVFNKERGMTVFPVYPGCIKKLGKSGIALRLCKAPQRTEFFYWNRLLGYL